VAPNLVITNPLTLCSGLIANLKAASITSGSEAGMVYTYWKDAAASIPLSDAEATAAVAGTYYIKGTNQAGCFAIKPVVVTVAASSAGTITPVNPPTVCNGETLLLTASTGISYQWYKNDVIINGANTRTYNVTSAGTYDVSINNAAVREKPPTRLLSRLKIVQVT
jgi:hypothetical protein